jgi:uncharacterized protein YmfQ (DUF2313 family)
MPALALIDKYQNSLLQLLPPGRAISKEPDSNVGKLMRAIAIEFARAHEYLDTVLKSANPADPGVDFITDWEEALALPDPSVALPSTAYDARRAAVAAKLIGQKDHSGPTAIAVAARFGASGLTFVRYPAMTCLGSCVDAIYADDWGSVVTINIPSATAGSAPGELTAALKALARSHGVVLVVFT